MTNDPIVAAVRAVRDELARQYNYDAAAILAEMRRREQVHGPRLVRQRARKPDAEQPADAAG